MKLVFHSNGLEHWYAACGPKMCDSQMKRKKKTHNTFLKIYIDVKKKTNIKWLEVWYIPQNFKIVF